MQNPLVIFVVRLSKCMDPFSYLYLYRFINEMFPNVKNHKFWKKKNYYAAPLRIGAWNDRNTKCKVLVIFNLKIYNKTLP